MTPGARLRAGEEVLTNLMAQSRPASVALADWGRSNRYAGSGDRSAIGNLVFDALRRKALIAHVFGDDSPRSLVLGAAGSALGLGDAETAAAADGSRFALAPLSQDEKAALQRLTERDWSGAAEKDVPAEVLGNFPAWLGPHLERAFGADVVVETSALAERAPLDLRVNALKATREKVLKALLKYGAEEGPLSPMCVRIPVPRPGGRLPNVEVDAAHGKGWFEVQDAGSQAAALLAGVGPREQVMDVCAGAGGKTLALSAAMQNTGQIYAYDRDRTQLRPIFERLKRAGARNVQVLDAGEDSELVQLESRFDCVFVDAPCTGSGTWRRRPDTKWRLKPEALETRILEQRSVLSTAQGLVKPGGRLIYVTCSLLVEENEDQMAWFGQEYPAFSRILAGELWQASDLQIACDDAGIAPDATSILLTPARHGTDGFFVAAFRRDA